MSTLLYGVSHAFPYIFAVPSKYRTIVIHITLCIFNVYNRQGHCLISQDCTANCCFRPVQGQLLASCSLT